MSNLFTIIQIVSGVALVCLVLFQSQGSGLGKAWGGGGEFYRSRRGVEKIVFRSTIAVSAIFLLASVMALLV